MRAVSRQSSVVSTIISLCVTLFAFCSSVEAQQPKKLYQIGYVSGRSGLESVDEVFKSTLRELGYVEKQNLALTYRWAEEKLDRIPALVVDLIQLNLDVIVTETTVAAHAAKNATKTIPIVIVLSGDAVGSGLVESLARPGANITGLTFIGTDVVGKMVELLKEISSNASRLVYLGNPDISTPEMLAFERMRHAAQRLGMTAKFVEVRGQSDLKGAFEQIKKARSNGLVVSPNIINVQNRKLIADRAAIPYTRDLWTKRFRRGGRSRLLRNQFS